MNKTKAQRYNENLDRIFNPEIQRLQKIEKIVSEIIDDYKEGNLDRIQTIRALTKMIK